MATFHVRFQREFTVDFEEVSLEACEKKAQLFLTQFPSNSTKLLSIIPEGYVEPEEAVLKPTPDPVAERNSKLADNVRDLLPHGPDAA